MERTSGRRLTYCTLSLLGFVLATAVLVPAAGASVPPLSVSANTQVSTRSPDPALAVQDFRSPVIAINPTNPRNMVMVARTDEPDYFCRVYYSSDAGVTWAPATGSTGASFPDPPLPAGAPPTKTSGTCWSPGVAFDAAGNVYVVAQDRPNGGGGPQTVIIWKSTNGGQRFGAPLTIPPSTTSGFSVQADIAIDTTPTSPHFGRIYVTWHEFPTGGLTATLTYSDNGGATWSSPTTQRIVGGQNQTIPDVTVAPDGTVYVAFRTATAGGTDCKGIGGLFGAPFPPAGSNCPIQILRSSNGGVSFDGDPVTVGTTFFPGGANNAIVQTAIAEEPSIVVTPSGTVLVAAATVPNPPAPGCAASLQAVLYRSTDRGQTWSAPRTINDDPCASGDEHRDPRLSVAPNGRVDAAFYDDRLDPTNHVVADPNKGLLYDVFYANSTDDGLSFGANTRVSDSSFDGTKLFKIRPPGSPPNGFQTRDYDMVVGLASLDSSVVAAWGDTRSGGPADLWSARIALPVPPPPPPPAPPPVYAGPAAPFAGCPTATANVIRGTAAGETITGTPAGDRIFAGAGDDRVAALAGNDCVDLGPGADRGDGGAGDDLLVGAAGRDRVSGAAGNDRIFGGADGDRLDGGSGNDRLSGDAGADVILGGGGRDRISAGSGSDRITGGAGNDVIKGNSGADRITGGSGRDTISGGSGNDRISARDGRRDRISCGHGRDTVNADRIDRVARDCERVRRR